MRLNCKRVHIDVLAFGLKMSLIYALSLFKMSFRLLNQAQFKSHLQGMPERALFLKLVDPCLNLLVSPLFDHPDSFFLSDIRTSSLYRSPIARRIIDVLGLWGGFVFVEVCEGFAVLFGTGLIFLEELQAVTDF